MKFFLLVNFILVSFAFSRQFEQVDYEIFDLQDELVKQLGPLANFYSALNISQDAKQTDVNRGYRKKSQELHPDKNPDAEANKLYKLLTSISAILKDKDSRAVYDKHLYQGFPVWSKSLQRYLKHLRKEEFLKNFDNKTTLELKKLLKKDFGLDLPIKKNEVFSSKEAIQILEENGMLPASLFDEDEKLQLKNLIFISLPINLIKLPYTIFKVLTEPKKVKDETVEEEENVIRKTPEKRRKRLNVKMDKFDFN
ncbi:DnaJ sub C member 1 [Clydaea vesicula]|uniref:DnaJ sub C member 1 n=1 Tax=Clydaea vesicula TaxID=447962 RepID=A0AAD5U155_9FUNG|nr:DnaJ sub C member 1 [Clydaea vesicula]